MAENAVGSLIQTLGSLLVKEGLLTRGLHRDIREIKLQLQSMQSFLKDADMRQHTQEGLRTWVEQVRNMAYEAEDIIDEYTYIMAKYRRKRLPGAIYNTISIPKKIFYLHRIGGKLQDIKSRLNTIEQNRIRYALPSCPETSNEAREMLIRFGESAYLPVDDLVGMERNKDFLIGWLTNEELQRMAYSVVGMGGLGKTTLVAKTYLSSEVQNHFDCCAWVTVSQSSDTMKILRDAIKKFMGSSKHCDRMDYRELVEILLDHLQLKRYVLILDDVWSINEWVQISAAFPRNTMGSRIIITTRDEEVASHVAELKSRVFHLQHMNENDAWTLFCQRAFKYNPDGACPDELESSARRIVKKCDGLPLAIVAIGSVMLSKQNAVEWRHVEDSFRWLLSNNRFLLERVKKVLLLSYYELPFNLKQCFLYCCTFPKDYVFGEDFLFRMLVAEGFVEEIEGLTLEEAARKYINELLGRCMIQYANHDYLFAKVYRVHDVMREIGVSIAKDENFIVNSNEREEPQRNRNARRLIVKADGETNLSQISTSNLRSYIVFGNGSRVIESFNPGFKLLRVLVLENAPLQEVPNSLGKLFNLRCLNLRNSNIRKLPDSLKRLHNLQTLDISFTKIEKLPCWIASFKKMRHLFMSYVCDDEIIGVEAPSGICVLKSLQFLMFVQANKELLTKIGNLTQLKGLGIYVRGVDGTDLCAALHRMKSLLHLAIFVWNDQEPPLELEALSSPLLQYLSLVGKLGRLPRGIGSLKNLVQLGLWKSNLSADPLSPLQALPNLEHLNLIETYDGDKLCFRAPFFLKLRRLHICGFLNLKVIEIEDGAMCHLQQMDLLSCQELKTLPMGIEYLRKLNVLLFHGMPEEFTNRLGPGGTDEDRSRIQHIASIKCYYPNSKSAKV